MEHIPVFKKPYSSCLVFHLGMEVGDFVETSFKLLKPLEDFFNNVFVMMEDERIRKNRLALLRSIADLPKGVADLSVLPGILNALYLFCPYRIRKFAGIHKIRFVKNA